MLSKKILDVILDDGFSETMITEWADTKDGPGADLIDGALEDLFQEENKNEPEKFKMKERANFEIVVAAVRGLLLIDMNVMGW